MKELTIQALLGAEWVDIAKLKILVPELGASSQCELAYQLKYAIQHDDEVDEHACGLALPVQILIQHESNNWFGFMDDIVPSGFARRAWVNFLGLQHASNAEVDIILLEKGAIAPVGNLRIKESLEFINPTRDLQNFSIDDIVNLNTQILDHTIQKGLIRDGAIGVGGEAPKLLIRLTKEQQVWVDANQQGFDQTDLYYLVKFPRNDMSEIDCNILRAEFHFYHELNELGFKTIDTQHMKLIEGSKYPSLWLPRFDHEWRDQQWHRHGLESVYSILNKASGSHLNHFNVINDLCNLLHKVNQNFNAAQFICEWLQRDLLNIIFGNSDNHGRNTSLIKRFGQISLAPIYDFAPMKVDPERITRTTTWGSPYEEGGEYRWDLITQALSPRCDPKQSMQALQSLAVQLSGLKARLIQRGVPAQIMKRSELSFDFIEAKLERWGVL